MTPRDKALLQSVVQAKTANTTNEDRLAEFAARIVSIYVMGEARSGEQARLDAMRTVSGFATLSGLNGETSKRVGDRAADILDETMAALRVAGTADMASMLMLMKQAKEGGE